MLNSQLPIQADGMQAAYWEQSLAASGVFLGRLMPQLSSAGVCSKKLATWNKLRGAEYNQKKAKSIRHPHYSPERLIVCQDLLFHDLLGIHHIL